MRRGLLLAFLVLALVGLAGCFEKSSPVDVTPMLAEFTVAPGGTVPVPLFLNSTMSFKQDLGMRVGNLPQGWTYRLSTDQVALPGYKGRVVLVNLTAPQDAPPGARDVEVYAGDTRATVRVNVTAPGAAVEPGADVRVSALLFDANGTVLARTSGDLLPQGLKLHRNATARPLPALVRVGAGESAEGAVRAAPALEEMLLGAREGQVLLLPGADVADPWRHEGASDGARLLVRIDEVLAPAAPPPAEAGEAAPVTPAA